MHTYACISAPPVTLVFWAGSFARGKRGDLGSKSESESESEQEAERARERDHMREKVRFCERERNRDLR